MYDNRSVRESLYTILMNIDREVIREIWNGKLAVCFQLDPEEVFGLQHPDPVYLMVPRLSYFPLIIDKVI